MPRNYKNSVYKDKNVTYYVNHEKKVVVAVLPCDTQAPRHIFDRTIENFEKAVGGVNLIEVHSEYFFSSLGASVNERYVGIARCNDEDVFDVEFGKKLALARAKEKKAMAIEKNFFKYIDQLDKLNYIAGKKHDDLYRRWINVNGEVAKLLRSIRKE